MSVTAPRTTLRHVTAAKAESIHSLARRMLDEAGGDTGRAATKLDNMASNIKRLNDEFRMLGVRTAISQIVQAGRAQALRDHNMTTTVPVAASTATTKAKAPYRMSAADKAAQARCKAAGVVIRSALMDMEYPIGGIVKKLRDWTGDEILAQGEIQLATARSSARNATFLIAVGKAAGPKKIGELGDATVEKLHKEAMSSGE
jgi:hypothetical protein